MADTFTGNANVTFYRVSNDPIEVTKTLNDGVTFSILFKNATDIYTPSLVIKSDIDLTQYNYMYIDKTQRYYYLDRIELTPGNVYNIATHCDVLMSFADEIKNCVGILKKTELNRYADLTIDDGSFINAKGAWTEVKVYASIDDGFIDTPKHVLITCGGGS